MARLISRSVFGHPCRRCSIEAASLNPPVSLARCQASDRRVSPHDYVAAAVDCRSDWIQRGAGRDRPVPPLKRDDVPGTIPGHISLHRLIMTSSKPLASLTCWAGPFRVAACRTSGGGSGRIRRRLVCGHLDERIAQQLFLCVIQRRFQHRAARTLDFLEHLVSSHAQDQRKQRGVARL